VLVCFIILLVQVSLVFLQGDAALNLLTARAFRFGRICSFSPCFSNAGEGYGPSVSNREEDDGVDGQEGEIAT
jgi:hypothetical protein